LQESVWISPEERQDYSTTTIYPGESASSPATAFTIGRITALASFTATKAAKAFITGRKTDQHPHQQQHSSKVRYQQQHPKQQQRSQRKENKSATS
jgi:hypothetical protein